MLKAGAILSTLFLFFIFTPSVEAANLTFVSDLISTSAPLASANHTISFKVTTSVPAGGQIIITPASNSFNIPASLDHTDVDFLVATTPGDYADRNIGAAANSSTDGIAVSTGANGSFTINLNSTTGLSAGNQVRILIGSHTAFQASGDQKIINPSTVGSYRIDIQTKNGSQVIDTARTFIAVVNQVAMEAEKTEGPPTMFNGSPSGAFSHTVTAVEIWLNTNENANCRYSTVSGQNYSSMANSFRQTNATLHTAVVGSLSPGASYSYYVKCADTGSNVTPLDLPISFRIKSIPPSGTIPGPVGGPEGAGGPPVIQVPSSSRGKPFPTDKASLLFGGLGFPGSKVHILKDGVSVGSVNVGDDSKFSFNLNEITRGVHTFSFYAIDLGGNKSNTTNATFSIISNTGNQISNIRILPTIKLAAKTIDPGSPLLASGFAIAKSSVQLDIYNENQPLTLVKRVSTLTDGSGKWSVGIDTAGLPAGNYFLRGKSILSTLESTAFTSNHSFGIGVSQEEKSEKDSAGASDLNSDSKINLVDFSILLFNWGSAGGNTASDLNNDETVNLTDFSILLFNWTG